MNRKLIVTALGLGLCIAAGAASARGWGYVGINIGVPVYARPAYVGPVYAPAPVVVAPAPVAYGCPWVEGHWRWNGWRETWVPGHCAYAASYAAPAPAASVSIGYAGRF
jgi:hypothetical protein